MAIKKSELYSSLWSGCDELRGGMDASQYKDYVLVLLFIKNVSDKYSALPYAPISIPPGASFNDMADLKAAFILAKLAIGLKGGLLPMARFGVFPSLV
jgi:type I restriction enzyme M protein